MGGEAAERGRCSLTARPLRPGRGRGSLLARSGRSSVVAGGPLRRQTGPAARACSPRGLPVASAFPAAVPSARGASSPDSELPGLLQQSRLLPCLQLWPLKEGSGLASRWKGFGRLLRSKQCGMLVNLIVRRIEPAR